MYGAGDGVSDSLINLSSFFHLSNNQRTNLNIYFPFALLNVGYQWTRFDQNSG